MHIRVCCDWMTMEYTHHLYCDVLLNRGACISRVGTAALKYALRYPGRGRPDANMFRWLEQRLRGTRSVTSTAHVIAGRPWAVRTPINEDSTIATVIREPWRSSRNVARELVLIQPVVLEVLHDYQLHPCHYSRNARREYRQPQMQFYEWLRHENTAASSPYIIFWWQKRRVLRLKVC
jgi:hypothetical protein